MTRDFSRRQFFRTAGGAAAGTGVLGFVAMRPAEASPTAGDQSRLGFVDRTDGLTADVFIASDQASTGRPVKTVVLEDFPPGWQPRRGDHVFLSKNSSGSDVALPLTTRLVGPLNKPLPEAAGYLTVGGMPVLLQQATLRSDLSTDGRRRERTSVFEAFCVENQVDGALSWLALRPLSGASTGR